MENYVEVSIYILYGIILFLLNKYDNYRDKILEERRQKYLETQKPHYILKTKGVYTKGTLTIRRHYLKHKTVIEFTDLVDGIEVSYSYDLSSTTEITANSLIVATIYFDHFCKDVKLNQFTHSKGD